MLTFRRHGARCARSAVVTDANPDVPMRPLVEALLLSVAAFDGGDA